MYVRKIGRYFYGFYKASNSLEEKSYPLRVEEEGQAWPNLRKIVREIEDEIAGIVPPREVREAMQRPFIEFIEDFIADKEALQRDIEYYPKMKSRLLKMAKECGWETLKYVTAKSYMDWRSNHSKGTEPHSAKTLNDHLSHISGLMNWLVKQGTIQANPMLAVQKIPLEGNQEENNRTISFEEFCNLLAKSPEYRALVYHFCGTTAIRRTETLNIRWSDLVLEGKRLCVRVRAKISKSKKFKELPISKGLAKALREYKAKQKDLSKPVFPYVPSVKDFRKDLVNAGIPLLDEDGRQLNLSGIYSPQLAALKEKGNMRGWEASTYTRRIM